MAFSVTVGAVDQTSKLLLGSLTMRYNSFDFTLKSPATVPALGDTVTVVTPTWSGTVVSVANSEPPRKQAARFVHITSTNANVPGASAAPWALSDVPSPPTSYAYRDLTYTLSRTPDGDTTQAHLTCYQSGLWPAMTVALTSANYGLTATNFTVSEVTVTWLNLTHCEYQVDLGDPLVTMSVWANSDSAGILPITRTKITDGEVTTPKLAANSVTSDKLAVGHISNVLTNPGFEDSARGTQSVIGSTSEIPGWTINSWGATGSSGLIQGPADGVAYEGKNWLYYTQGSSMSANFASATFAIAPGETLSLSARVYGTGYLGVDYIDSAGSYVSSAAVANGSGSWVQLSGFVVAPSGVVAARATLQGGAPGTHTSFDDVVAMRGGGVWDSSGITIYNGKLTVINAGATVIIDGTSDMFKIAATGTLSVAWHTVPGIAYASVTLTGLGSGFTTPPPMQANLAPDSSSNGYRRVGHLYAGYAAGAETWVCWVENAVSAGQVGVNLFTVASSDRPGAVDAACRYFVLVEAGI